MEIYLHNNCNYTIITDIFQKTLGCTTKSTGILYSKYGTITFEFITPKEVYNQRNDFSIKVKAFRKCFKIHIFVNYNMFSVLIYTYINASVA